MKKLILSIALLISMASYSQTSYKIGTDGRLISTKVLSAEKNTKTEYTIKIKDTTYTVFKSAKGKYYINRVSAKTNKIYKSYIKIEN